MLPVLLGVGLLVGVVVLVTREEAPKKATQSVFVLNVFQRLGRGENVNNDELIRAHALAKVESAANPSLAPMTLRLTQEMIRRGLPV